mgnify:FL=1
MILKDKDQLPETSNKRLLAGDHQEKNVAFYLRRAFKDRDDVLVINDLRIVHNGETAQIDHLVITELGFCLVESKSIKATVKINKEGEWTRVYAGNLKGIPSPIKQVELQEKLLRDLLAENKSKILGKVLGMQQGFGGRKWVTICAISSDAVIDRKYLPKELNERVMKSEFISDWVDKNIAMKQGVGKKLRAITSTPLFTQSELLSIGEFLLSQHTPVKTQESNQKESSIEVSKEAVVKVPPESETNTSVSPVSLCCKQCKSSDKLTGMYGKYGYYAKCGCGVNTSMKRDCPKCDSAMRVKKDKAKYTASCECGEAFLVFEGIAL